MPGEPSGAIAPADLQQSSLAPAQAQAPGARGPVTVENVDVLALKKEERTQFILKIVFAVIICVTVVIVGLALYSMLTQKCPSTSSSSYTPSLACSSSNVINQVGNAIGWVQAHWWVFLVVPIAGFIIQPLGKFLVSKFGKGEGKGGEGKGGGGEGGGGEGGGGK